MRHQVIMVLAALAVAPAMPADAQGVRMERNLSLDMARAIGETALETCRKNGFHVSVTVLDRAGQVRLALRDDDARPHTAENSQRKAYTSRTFGIPSSEFAARVQAEPARAAQATLSGVIALAGALPIKVGDDIIGAVGVSGSPGGDKDEACARAGIEKVAEQLK